MADPIAALDEDNETAETATCGGGGGATGFPPHCTIDSMTTINASNGRTSRQCRALCNWHRTSLHGLYRKISDDEKMRDCDARSNPALNST